MSFASEHKLVQATPARSKPFYIWVDFETTGLDHDTDVPVEFGYVLTNIWGEVIPGTEDVNKLWEPTGPYGNQYRNKWENLSDLVKEMHDTSGLWDEIEFVRQYTAREDISEETRNANTNHAIEQDALDYLRVTENIAPRTLRVAGSSIHFDKTLLHNWMPDLEAYLHYRALDVSSYIEVCQNTNPVLAAKMPVKREIHRPLADIADSIRTYTWMLQEFVMPDWRVYDEA